MGHVSAWTFFIQIVSDNTLLNFLILERHTSWAEVDITWTSAWRDSSISSVIELRLVWTSFLDFRQLKWSPIDHWVPPCVPSFAELFISGTFAFFKNNFVRRHTTTSPPPTLAQPRQNRLFDRDKTKTSLFRHWPFFDALSALWSLGAEVEQSWRSYLTVKYT